MGLPPPPLSLQFWMKIPGTQPWRSRIGERSGDCTICPATATPRRYSFSQMFRSIDAIVVRRDIFSLLNIGHFAPPLYVIRNDTTKSQNNMMISPKRHLRQMRSFAEIGAALSNFHTLKQAARSARSCGQAETSNQCQKDFGSSANKVVHASCSTLVRTD